MARAMFAFAIDPGHGGSRAAPPAWRGSLPLACAVVLLAAAFPWTSLLEPDSTGPFTGPRGFRTTSGFSVTMTSLLCLLLCALENGTHDSAQIVRPGCLFATAIGAIVMASALIDGPGQIAGLPAAHTSWFAVAGAATAAAVLAAAALQRALRRDPQRGKRTGLHQGC